MDMKKYSSISDDELITMMHDGDGEVVDYLMEKYKDLVRSCAGSMFILGGDSQDLLQEGMIGLLKAVREYDCGRDAGFRTFANLCIRRQIYTAVRASGRQKHAPLNSYISLYSTENENGEQNGLQLGDVLQAAKSSEPEAVVLENEINETIASAIEESLSPLEKEVLDLYVTGLSYTEIAHILGRDEKSTDNALQRIRSKLKKYIRAAEV